MEEQQRVLRQLAEDRKRQQQQSSKAQELKGSREGENEDS
jgi:hypothetical protein